MRLVRREFAKALEDYTTAIKFNENFAGAYFNRGAVHLALKQYNAAIADWGNAINIEPDFLNAYVARGKVKVMLNRIEEAKVDLQIGLNITEKQGNNELKVVIQRRLRELNEMK